MRFDETVKELSPKTVEALRVLESEGFQICLDVRVEDMTNPDGQRRRTFSNRGRYAVGALLKNLGGRDRVEVPAFTPDLNQGINAPVFVQEVEIIAPMEGEVTLESGKTVASVEMKIDPLPEVPDEKPAKIKRKGGRR